jgi:N-methylhydantoinase B
VSEHRASLDPASLQVLIARLTGVADEMGAVLRRAAYSPNIKERADCSAALFTASGELLVQAEHIPVHLGSMPASVAAAIDALDGAPRPGEQVVLNDPFAGGTHLNDITVVAPVFASGALVGWAANRAHHADLGGMAPGSMPPDATEINQEGIRIPPVRCTPEVEDLIVASSRAPAERRGDLAAQLGANAVGVERLGAIVDRLGGDDALGAVVDYGERRMRAALLEVPDGVYAFDDVLDSAGPRPVQQSPTRVVVRVTIAGDGATFDFTGTDAQRPGNVNAVEAVTVSAVAFALRYATDPTIPANGGAMRPVRVIAPPGTVVAARPPVAVGAGNVEVSQRVADVCLGALAAAVPRRIGAAGQGTMNNVLVGGAGWVYYETIGGGQGGRPGRGGMSGVHTAMTNTRDTPVEALERALPLRVRRYSLRERSGGAGEYPGGDGIVRELEVLEPATVSLVTERRVSSPWGLAGGEPGAPGANHLLPGGDAASARALPDKVTVDLVEGDVIRIETPGGGGWGSPSP